ncbi:NTE family protein [Balneicella halophila]|uniref:NTE family protein n=1 Tax=Balneicella halophila TaxID=1537566 RepID=A0A7L4UPR3_BALHA|nr:patatin-like phospholipase family protein [Balneicella halophila]PVX51733.1 NTE family protein [Balneicella halophila]
MTRNKLSIFLSVIFLLLTAKIDAQNIENQQDSVKSRPTVALVLSGGGAKGFAEIGTLEAIDELGIPIDYVVGTSMGSIVGGFYAIGYSGKEIAEQVDKIEWSTVFTDKITSRKIPVIIKDELSRYAFSFPIKDKIRLPKGIIQGQRVMNILSKYTIGYHQDKDFSNLPIPYSCVGTDIETGEAVVFERGSLPIVMRASMAIPSVFTPQRVGNRVFVDGGVINNFPADVAKAKGFDYIIGVYVQSPLLEQSEINSAADIVNQLVSFAGKPRLDQNKKLTDIYISPNITGFNAGSFDKEEIDTLIQRGRDAAKKHYDELKALKEKLGENVAKEELSPPPFDEPIRFKAIKVKGLEDISENLFFTKLDLDDKDSISVDELEKTIGDVSSVLGLDLLTYKVLQDTLQFDAHERLSNRFNVGLHYDSDNEGSVLMNLTLNNLLIKNSRASADAILGRDLQFTGRYTIKFGKVPYLNLMFDTKDYSLTRYIKNDKVIEGDVTYVKFDMNAQMILWDNYSAGVGIRKEYVDYKDVTHMNTILSERTGNDWYTHHYAFISLDILDDPSYPTRGIRFDGEANYISNGAGETGTVLYANLKRAYSIGKKFSTIVNLYGRTILDNQLSPIYKNYWGGINDTKYLTKHIPFVGANWVQGYNDMMAVARIDFRYRLFKNNYLVLAGNYGRYSDDIDNFFSSIPENIWGGGITYSYDSIVGPIEATIMHSTEVSKPILHVSIGYNF